MPKFNNKNFNNFISEEKLKKHVLTEYNLEDSNIQQIKFKDTDKQRAVYKITSSQNIYCLKKVYYSEKDLLFIYSALEWLFRYGLKVPNLLPNRKGGRFVNYKNMLFILTPWIVGEKCDYDNNTHVLSSASALATMHFYSENFFPIEGSNIRQNFENIYVSVNKHFFDLLSFSNLAENYKSPFSIIFLENFETSIKLAKITTKFASTINFHNLNKSLCHLDFVNKNIIFDKNNEIWLIDFDKCKIDYCVHDISYFLRRFLRRDTTKWNIELLKGCLEKYEDVRPLNLDEYKYILTYICFPQKYWKTSKDYYKNIKECDKSNFISLIENSVKNLEFQLEFTYKFIDLISERFKLNQLTIDN